jgi:hypothetical protein
VGFFSGPYNRIHRALRRANRAPRPHHRGPRSAPVARAPKLVAGGRRRRGRPRGRWPERIVYLLIAMAAVSLVLRLLLP